MHVILNSKPLQEVNCVRYLRSQVAKGGGCESNAVHRINEGYSAEGSTLKYAEQ